MNLGAKIKEKMKMNHLNFDAKMAPNVHQCTSNW